MGSDHERLQNRADKWLQRIAHQEGRHEVNASSLLRTFTIGKSTELPVFDQPSPIDPSQVHYLGEARRKKFYTHEKYGCEFVAGRLLSDRDEAPNRLLIVGTDADGARVYTPLAPVPVGSFEAAQAAAPVRPPKPSLPVDSMGRMFLAPSKSRPGAPAARGAEAIIRMLATKRASVSLSRDGLYFVVTSPGGRAGPGVAELAEAGAALILAHLQGHPLPCAGDHKGVAPEAVTLALGGAPLCSKCVSGM